ncbi:TerD family protein [Aquipuribacter hungaricus]|uniref:TerD family protein n=1 Tax=Aquipuribacter hungaricus TaxID=545624 RepID=A0ABV7WF99_9MICO
MRRGTNVALTKEIPGLTRVVVAVRLATSEEVLARSLVVAAILCDEGGRALGDDHFVFFNQLADAGRSVVRLDVRSAAPGPEEQVEVDLDRVPEDVRRVVFVAYVNGGTAQRRTLSQLREATVRVLQQEDDAELVRSENLVPGFGPETGVVLCELYRHRGDWKFRVVGQGYDDGMVGMAADHGITL